MATPKNALSDNAATMIGMSTAVTTAHKLLIMNAGGFTFGNFVRVGIPLTLSVSIVVSLLLPTIYLPRRS